MIFFSFFFISVRFSLFSFLSTFLLNLFYLPPIIFIHFLLSFLISNLFPLNSFYFPLNFRPLHLSSSFHSFLFNFLSCSPFFPPLFMSYPSIFLSCFFFCCYSIDFPFTFLPLYFFLFLYFHNFISFSLPFIIFLFSSSFYSSFYSILLLFSFYSSPLHFLISLSSCLFFLSFYFIFSCSKRSNFSL